LLRIVIRHAKITIANGMYGAIIRGRARGRHLADGHRRGGGHGEGV